MNQANSEPAFRLSAQLVNIIAIFLGIAAAYFMTIQSLKVELAAKAEGAVVEALDKKLTSFEVFLKQGVVSKEQFYQFSTDVEARLIRIEDYLRNKPGEGVGK